MSDSLRAVQDSIARVKDSLHRADSAFRADSVSMLHKSSLERPAFTAAKDSIIEDFSEGKRRIYYYGDVKVTYGTMELTADYMEYDMLTGIVYARGTQDTLTGEWKGTSAKTRTCLTLGTLILVISFCAISLGSK